MQSQEQALIDVEKRFWQSVVDKDAETAVGLLTNPSIVVNPRGTRQMSHDDYRRFTEHGERVVKAFEMSNVRVTFPNAFTGLIIYQVRLTFSMRSDPANVMTQDVTDTSTWVKAGDGWVCVMHTETPAGP